MEPFKKCPEPDLSTAVGELMSRTAVDAGDF